MAILPWTSALIWPPRKLPTHIPGSRPNAIACATSRGERHSIIRRHPVSDAALIDPTASCRRPLELVKTGALLQMRSAACDSSPSDCAGPRVVAAGDAVIVV